MSTFLSEIHDPKSVTLLLIFLASTTYTSLVVNKQGQKSMKTAIKIFLVRIVLFSTFNSKTIKYLPLNSVACRKITMDTITYMVIIDMQEEAKNR